MVHHKMKFLYNFDVRMADKSDISSSTIASAPQSHILILWLALGTLEVLAIVSEHRHTF
jgi:hypothetical protein